MLLVNRLRLLHKPLSYLHSSQRRLLIIREDLLDHQLNAHRHRPVDYQKQ
ncbi:hypothetical protein CY0110_19482 [Crocosphaera chwakensis CCY0110]|uniref:Uncharacterized protein n=1 Tax=Crocosphaera chwakensis CCY0110 TaxID=391612 RepID=A3IJM8_9CHRO|nr:hypothetical protein CY0110_19482 [Crocosphaera chwakensis CCY0110]